MTIEAIIKNALTEDAAGKDWSTQYLIPAGHKSIGRIVARQHAVLCGLNVAQKIFRRLDKNIRVQSRFKDGQTIAKGSVAMVMKGETRAILTGERTALNFLSHLSAVATETKQYVTAARPARAKILDTRKTTPGLRALEKYAVRCGGGTNHRMNLDEMLMIKDNHRHARRDISLQDMLAKLRASTRKKIIIEVDSLAELKALLPSRPDCVLLDNMSIPQIKKAVQLTRKISRRTLVEVSGGINLNSVKRIAQTGVDRISVGGLTHSAQHIDFSLEVTPL